MVVDTILEEEETLYIPKELIFDDNIKKNNSFICKATSISLMVYGSVLLTYKLYKIYNN
jgi:hypothetical protein